MDFQQEVDIAIFYALLFRHNHTIMYMLLIT